MTVDDLIPAEFAALIAGRAPEPDVSGDDWLRSLPRLVRGALARWELTVDGASMFGTCALIVPVVTADQSPAVLKIGWPHVESRHEHLALRAWDGRGAVELLAADPSRGTLLLARLSADRDLRSVPVDEACAVIGALLRRLDLPALPQLPRLSGWAQRAARFDSPAAASVPRRFLQQARSTISDLLSDEVDSRLVHTDLHYENVLDGPSGWTAIDPKPMAAEPAFAVWSLLHNRCDEMRQGLAWGVHERLGWACDAGQIDEDRARAWSFVRTVADAVDVARRGDSDLLTARIALAKALQQRW